MELTSTIQQEIGRLDAAANSASASSKIPLPHRAYSDQSTKTNRAAFSALNISAKSHSLLSCRINYVRLHIARATSNTVSSVGTVTSSSGGENGMGTCIAPMRLTGASRS